jgi:ubiquinol-cytochrome c reductase cytochrome b subunit
VHDIFAVSLFLIVFSAIVFFAPEMGGYFLEFNNFIPADPLKTPAHIAPVWYFTPFYSMLRATTSDFMPFLWAFFVVVGFVSVRRSQLPPVVKSGYWGLMALLFVAFGVGKVLLGWAGVTVANPLIDGLLGGYDAKFWGVVVMGGSVVILFFLPWLDHSPAKSIRYRPDGHSWVYAVFVVFFVVLGYLGIKPPSTAGTLVSQVGTLFYFGFFLLMPWWSRLGAFKPVPDRVTFTAH